jgi:hypothetical protein
MAAMKLIRTLSHRRVCAGLALVGLALGAHAQSVAPDVPPTRVTTDSAAYCDQLATQVADERKLVKAVPSEVHVLSHEGHKMCREGMLKPGIYRLRRALQILHGEQ